MNWMWRLADYRRAKNDTQWIKGSTILLDLFRTRVFWRGPCDPMDVLFRTVTEHARPLGPRSFVYFLTIQEDGCIGLTRSPFEHRPWVLISTAVARGIRAHPPSRPRCRGQAGLKEQQKRQPALRTADHEADAKGIIKAWVSTGLLVSYEYENPTSRKQVKGLKVDNTKRPS
jgi:hypothetical protein